MRRTIVFVPGFNCTAALWAPQLAAFSDRFDCRIADHTKSDTMAGIARDILAAAPDEFVLCGLSMGGYIAFEIMRQAPERVAGLALLDTQATPESEQQKVSRAERIRTAKEQGMPAVAELQWPQLVHPARYEDEQLHDVQRRMAIETGLDVFMRQATAIMHRPDSRPDLPKIGCPTLVLTGEQDLLTPPDKAREMADGIPGATLVLVPDCGHLSTIEKPKTVNAALELWLA